MSMYAYWLANSGLTVHKLTGLMTEGIRCGRTVCIAGDPDEKNPGSG